MSNPTPSVSSTTVTEMSRSMTVLFAVAGGAAVGNLYWAQPLLDTLADDFGVTPAAPARRWPS